MSERRLPGASSPGGAPGPDMHVRVEALRARGAALFDPVGFRVIEAMLRRLDAFEGGARTALIRKIERRLAALCERFERAGGEARAAVGREAAPARRECGPLAELLAHLACDAVAPLAYAGRVMAGAGAEPGAEPATELKSLRYFRSTWSRLSLEQQLSHALAQAPDNAGPLNSHFLVLQALIRMRDIAPSYLEGFIAHAQALLWLEQADGGRGKANRGAAQRTAARKGDVRPRGGRGRKKAG